MKTSDYSAQEMAKEILHKIKNKSLRVGVIGLGYVGLPLATEIAAAGFATTGFDTDASKIEMIKSRKNYISDIDDLKFNRAVESGKLSADTDFSKLSEKDFIFICVPTPLDNHKQPNMMHIYDSVKVLSEYLKNGTAVVLESTTYPGTTEEYVLPLLEKGSGLKCGKDFYLGFSPERVDPGNQKYKTQNTPKVVGAVGEDASWVICSMYRAFLESTVYEVSSPAVAEMEKLLENTYRNVNIGLVNEFAVIANKLGINIWEVIEAARTKPYGFQAFYPGPGLGGHCIPLDPSYLTWKLKEHDYTAKIIEASDAVNTYMPAYVTERCAQILNRFRKPLNGSKILLLGVAYKQNISDYRESPALKVIEYLEKAGAEVSFYDPYVSSITHKNKFLDGIGTLTSDNLRNSDLVVITTGHTNLDYEFVQKNSTFIFDTRNVMEEIQNRDNVEVL